MSISRRDFLKLSSVLATSALFPSILEILPSMLSSNPNAKNVLIIVIDALSATNINFYGYPRETMPNLTRLLDRATVYPNHYASANFTTPGTASLLTGRHPWDHLALKHGDTVIPELETRSIFSYFDQHHKIAYTHNHFADKFLYQFGPDISNHVDPHTLFLQYTQVKSSEWFDKLMSKDPDLAMLFKSRLNDPYVDGFIYSLLFPSLLGEDHYQLPVEITSRFPRGLPQAAGPFTLEDAIEWTGQEIAVIPQPFLGYFHFLPPHSPYNTRIDFFDTFLDDDYYPPRKPRHPVVIQDKINTQQEELDARRHYDEYLLYVDSEFLHLFNDLENQGILDNTLLIVTSDHGEMFERKTLEHKIPVLFDPATRIPMAIFKPGQTDRVNITKLTSCVDLLPTLLDYCGYSIPADLPCEILPDFSEESSKQDRKIYAMDARWNQDYSHLETATLMMRKDQLKIIRYSNYANYYRNTGFNYKYESMQSYQDPYFQVYDLEQDPEEIQDLAIQPTAEIQSLIDDLEQYYRKNVEFPG